MKKTRTMMKSNARHESQTPREQAPVPSSRDAPTSWQPSRGHALNPIPLPPSIPEGTGSQGDLPAARSLRCPAFPLTLDGAPDDIDRDIPTQAGPGQPIGIALFFCFLSYDTPYDGLGPP